ncbi:hypothetical protein D3C72_883540 [compost metagenome]
MSISLQGLEFVFLGTTAGQGAEFDAGFDQRTGLVPVHVFQGFLVKLQADRTEIDGLTADHACRARRQCQGADHLQADFGIRRAQARV